MSDRASQLGDESVSPRDGAVEAVARALLWLDRGMAAALAGPEYETAKQRAEIAVSTMQAAGWHLA